MIHHNKALRDGIWAGLITILLYTLVYAVNPISFFSPVLYWGSLGIFAYFMWRSAKHSTGSQTSLPDFRQSLRSPFVVFLIANFLYWTFYALMFTFAPNMGELSLSSQLQFLDWMQTALPTGFFDEGTYRDMKTVLEKQPVKLSVTQLLYSYLKGAIGGFILSLLIALIVRRSRR